MTTKLSLLRMINIINYYKKNKQKLTLLKTNYNFLQKICKEFKTLSLNLQMLKIKLNNQLNIFKNQKNNYKINKINMNNKLINYKLMHKKTVMKRIKL